MIVPRTSREEILQKLQAKIRGNVPILISSAGNGLVAQLLESAGADCVNTFSGARLRANGMGTMSMLWPILDSNKQTIDYTSEDIMPALTGDAFEHGLAARIVLGVDESHGSRFRAHDQRLGGDAARHALDSLEHPAAGHAGRGEHDVAVGEPVEVELAVGVGEPHAARPLALLVPVEHEAAHHLAADAL